MRDRTFVLPGATLAVVLAVFVASAASAAVSDCTLYVRAGFVPAAGQADGLTPETAFATITLGARAVRGGGDVVCVGPGLYVDGDISPLLDGAPGVPGQNNFPVVIRGDATGASTDDAPGAVRLVPPTDLPMSETPGTGFLLLGRHEVVIEGFDISGFGDAGIQTRASNRVADFGANSADLVFRNNTIRGCRAGIDVHGAGLIVIEHNVIVGNNGSGISVESCTATAPAPFCRGIVGSPVVPVVSNNRSGGNSAHGIFLRVGQDAVVQNNVLYRNGDSGVTLRGVADGLLANNLVYHNAQAGVSIGAGFVDETTSGEAAEFTSPNAIMLNNTIYDNAKWGVEVGSSLAASPGAAVVNNIVWHNGDDLLGVGILNERGGVANVREPSVCSYVSGFNDVLDDYGPDTPRNNYDLRTDPRFVDIAGPDGVLGGEGIGEQFIDRSADDDFHLSSDSPAVNAGSTTVTRLGITGSTSTLGTGDQGTVDLGYHYGASAEQVLFYESPYMPLFVRQSGDDTGDGLSPATAFASIGTAARRARAGVTVVVGPGVYRECDIHSPPDSGRAVFLADGAGAQTGDAPGMVLVDASGCQTGFNLASVCGVVIDGFHVTGASDDGIQLQNQCDRGIVRNTVVFANAKRGINVTNSDDVRIGNNLVFGNDGGIQIGSGALTISECADGGSKRATLEFNTAYNSTFDGILIGAGVCPSIGATVAYNVTGGNRGNGLKVGADTTREQNLVGYTSRYNLIADNLATGLTRGVGDLIINLANEPLYLDPTQIALSGDWRRDAHFRLAQRATGQTLQSRAVDFSDITALKAGLSTRSTRSDGVADAGVVDRGYHYPTDSRAAAGDCNADGKPKINELLLAVNVALGNAPLDACTAADVDGDGTVSIADLILAVNAALAS